MQESAGVATRTGDTDGLQRALRIVLATLTSDVVESKQTISTLPPTVSLQSTVSILNTNNFTKFIQKYSALLVSKSALLNTKH
jgi:hypothetical protein